MGRVGTTSARALVILVLIVSLIVSVVFRDIVSRLVVNGVAGLLGIVDLGEDLLDLLEGCGALDLERRNTSKERRKRGTLLPRPHDHGQQRGTRRRRSPQDDQEDIPGCHNAPGRGGK